MKNNIQAFPVIGHEGKGDSSGMTLLDYFASKVMQSMTPYVGADLTYKNIAEKAYNMAEIMLEERKKHF